tara:strand:+ start:534 stop:668 length:135 start_codon:yes stop_codon:yes gene_type:complete
MNAGMFVAYVVLWSTGFIAVRAITAGPMQSIENFVAGTKVNGGA